MCQPRNSLQERKEHFIPIEHFSGNLNYDKTKKRDKLKDKLAIENNCYLEYNIIIQLIN